jgi:hypothetical protein
MKDRPDECPCTEPGCSCRATRREFLWIAGAGAAAAIVHGVPLMAGPFAAEDFEKLVPADKKLHPDWVRSLFARGSPTVYHIALCGFEHHGPKGHIGFAPKLSPEGFRAAFTAAEGWGTFSQKREGTIQRERIEVKRGRLRLHTLAFEAAAGAAPSRVRATRAGKPVESSLSVSGGRLEVRLAAEAIVGTGESLEVEFS